MGTAGGATIRFVALDEIPGGMPAASVERDGAIYVYVSRAHSIDDVCSALTAVMNTETRRSWVHMGRLSSAVI